MSQPQSIQCAHQVLDFSAPKIMGILNITPDSFSDGGRYLRAEAALAHANEMVAAGADIIDIGGESTRPGAQLISEQEELDRVLPIIEYVHRELGVLVSVDTSNARVMREAVAAGADIINDVRALQRPGALEAVADLQVPVILMHSLLEQLSPGFVPHYEDVVAEVKGYLSERVNCCEAAGIKRENIILDPGFGGGMFGKTPSYDLEMIKRFDEFFADGLPVLAGISRKSFMARTLDKPATELLPATLGMTALLLNAGAHIIRVHDVAETKDVLTMVQALKAI